MSLNLAEIMAVPDTFQKYSAAQAPAAIPSVASNVGKYVYNGGTVQADLTKIYGGTPSIIPASSSSIWDSIAKSVTNVTGAVTSISNAAGALKTAFAAPKAEVVSAQQSASAQPVSVSLTTPQVAPSLNNAVPATQAEGMVLPPSAINMTPILIIAGVVILISIMMRR